MFSLLLFAGSDADVIGLPWLFIFLEALPCNYANAADHIKWLWLTEKSVLQGFYSVNRSELPFHAVMICHFTSSGAHRFMQAVCHMFFDMNAIPNSALIDTPFLKMMTVENAA